MLLDVFVVVVVIWSVFQGLKTGLIMSATSLLGLFVAVVLASKHLNYLYCNVVKILKIDNFPMDVNENYYIYIASYLIFILFFYLLIYYVAYFIKSLFGILMLGWIDKIFGALFGLAKGTVLSIGMLIVLSFLGKFNSSLRHTLSNSEVVKALPDISMLAVNILPEDIRENVESYVQSANSILRRGE